MRSSWVLAITCVCGLAYAQPAGDADAHLERGKHLYELQDYDGAIAAYQAGYLLEQRAEFLYGIGQAYRMKGDCERASRSYTAVMRAPDGAALADAARQNIARCRPAGGSEPAPPPPDPAPPPDPRPPDLRLRSAAAPTPHVAVASTPWYRDALGGALVIGGVALLSGGAIAWNVGRDQADRTYDATSYEAWSASSRDARHADTLQRLGVAAVTVGGAAMVAGVIRYVWPKRPQADLRVAPTGASAGVTFAF